MAVAVDTAVERWARDYFPIVVEYSSGDREVYKPFGKQLRFHSSPAKYRLFGGAAGPGKTLALIFEAMMHCHQPEADDRVHTLLLRRTYPQLEGSLLTQFRRHVPAGLYASFDETKKTVKWKTGATTRFGSMQYEKNVWDYQGHEYLFVGWDELTQFTLKQWQTMSGWNRCAAPVAVEANMAGATNPIGIGREWVKSLWIQRKPAAGMDEPQLYDAEQFEFIPALISDNPIYAEDKNYLTSLSKMPRHLRDALLKGSWDVVAGTYFDVLDRARHVRRAETIPELRLPWTTKWVSVDWGFEHNAAVYWHAQVGHVVVTYREFVENKLGSETLAFEIARRSSFRDEEGREQKEEIEAVYLSPDAFAHRDNQLTIAERMGTTLRKEGLPLPQRADDDRVGGWTLMYEKLEAEPAEWIITDNCEALLEVLPTLPRDDKNVEDALKMEGDDPAEAVRYGLKSRHKAGKKPIEETVREKVAAITDPTSRAIATKNFLYQERRKNRSVVRYRRPRYR